MERIVKGIWIPIEIWMNKDLSWNEKILLMEIDSFTSKDRECYISNEYIAELLGVSVSWASKCLSHLLDLGLVRVVKFDGRKRYVESTIQFKADLNDSSMQDGIKVPHTNNNEYINNTLSNKDTRQKFVKPSIEEIRQYCQEKGVNVDAEQFFNFYESKGWLIGKSPMENWRAAVSTWAKRMVKSPNTSGTIPRKKESVLEHNLKVMDQMFGTNYHEQTYGKKEVCDEQ